MFEIAIFAAVGAVAYLFFGKRSGAAPSAITNTAGPPMNASALLAQPLIKRGSADEGAVRLWQGVLVSLGYLPPGGADGDFGPGTDAATRAAQAAAKLLVDGVVGADTWRAAAEGRIPRAGSVATSAPAPRPAAPAPSAPKPAPGSAYGSGPKESVSVTSTYMPVQIPNGGDDGGGAPAVSPGRTGDGRMFLRQNAPPDTTNQREQVIFDAIVSGLHMPIRWAEVISERDGHVVKFYASFDAVMIGTSDPVRVNVRHSTAQKIADYFGAVLPTSRMSDLAYEQATLKINPQVMAADIRMSTTDRMIEHSDKVSQQIRIRGYEPNNVFVRDVGKDWVNTERLLDAAGNPARAGHLGGGGIAAANFGWHSSAAGLKSPAGFPVYQSIGLAHDLSHTDYSQVVTLYNARCMVNGVAALVSDVLTNPEFAYLLSDEVQRGTAARVTRHPAV